MVFTDIRAFLKTQLKTLGYTKEHKDAFDISNIPSTAIAKVFSLEYGAVSQRNVQVDIDTLFPVTIRLWFKDYNDNLEARDKAMEKGENLIKLLFRPDLRTSIDCVSQYQLLGMLPIALAESNDNVVELQVTLGFFITLPTLGV